MNPSVPLLTQEIERHAIRLRKHMNFPSDILFKIAEYLVTEALLNMCDHMINVREGGKPTSRGRRLAGKDCWELGQRGLITSKYSFTPKRLGGPLRIKFTCFLEDHSDFLCIRFCSSGKRNPGNPYWTPNDGIECSIVLDFGPRRVQNGVAYPVSFLRPQTKYDCCITYDGDGQSGVCEMDLRDPETNQLLIATSQRRCVGDPEAIAVDSSVPEEDRYHVCFFNREFDGCVCRIWNIQIGVANK
eukprot:PhF_6_TR31760/c0_g1_i2/m.46759